MYINTDFRKETHADGELRNSQFTLHSQAREVERVPRSQTRFSDRLVSPSHPLS